MDQDLVICIVVAVWDVVVVAFVDDVVNISSLLLVAFLSLLLVF